jgi:hypothetical protein
MQFLLRVALSDALVDCQKSGASAANREARMGDGNPLRRVALVQGIYFLATGLWPLLHMESFLAVTGPKIELWLVRTVGVLVMVIGLVLVLSWRRREVSDEIVCLAVGSALGLAAIDIIYVLARTIPPVYLADAALELALVVWWAAARWRGQART